MTRAVGPFLLLLFLTGCGVDIRNRPRQQWVGPLTSTANPAECPPTRAVLIVGGGDVTFTPDQSTWVLNGKIGPDTPPATATATRTRTTTDHRTYKTDLQVRWTEQAAEGTYTTPRCNYRLNLDRF